MAILATLIASFADAWVQFAGKCGVFRLQSLFYSDIIVTSAYFSVSLEFLVTPRRPSDCVGLPL